MRRKSTLAIASLIIGLNTLPVLANENVSMEEKLYSSMSKTDVLTTGTWVDQEPNVRVVGETTPGDGAPFCKNTRYTIKAETKGIQFDVKLPPKPKFNNNNHETSWDNHCIYIGYEGLEIGLSVTPARDGDKGYTWFYNYSPATPGVTSENKYGRGAENQEGTYFPYGSTVTMQLYLDPDGRLHFNVGPKGNVEKNVWVSPDGIKHSWSNYKYVAKDDIIQPGTRIINSIEQNERYDAWNVSHEALTVSNIRLSLGKGWVAPKPDDVKWGMYEMTDRYGKRYGGAEYTIPHPDSFPSRWPLYKKFFSGMEDLGSLPILSYGDVLTDNFTVTTPK